MKILISIKDGKVQSVKATSNDQGLTTVMTHDLDTDEITGHDWTWDHEAVEGALTALNQQALNRMEKVKKTPLEASVGSLLTLFTPDKRNRIWRKHP